MTDTNLATTLTIPMVEKALIEVLPDEHWVDFEEATEHNCHSASLALVKSDLFDEARVARGTARGVGGQHSWVVLGAEPIDCYMPETTIVDITLWSYDERKPKLWIGTMADGIHVPHFGSGTMITWGCPESGGGEEVVLTPETRLSPKAVDWLKRFHRIAGGPLDIRFWATLMSHAPYWGWPSEEFTLACYQTDKIRAFIPIDRIGMQTDVNPGGLYLRGDGDD